ncbi:MAG: ubiquinol-cytochrome c reductase iron-sulfur subunit [Gemmatimonadota bacterium]
MNRPGSGGPSRRAFVGRSLAILGASPAVMVMQGCASLVTRTIAPVDGRLVLGLAQFPDLSAPGGGGALRVRPAGDDRVIYILALGGNRFSAVSPVCTHLGCTVDIQGARLVCPCHGSTYDREGRVLQGPAADPLQSFPTTVGNDGVLTIDLGARP